MNARISNRRAVVIARISEGQGDSCRQDDLNKEPGRPADANPCPARDGLAAQEARV